MAIRAVELSIYRAGQLVGRANLGPGIYTIGRVEDCHVMLPDVGISRRHALLHVDEQGLWVEDCGSGNGSWYRGKRIDRQVMGDGDELQLEPFVLHFQLGPEPTGEVTAFQGNSSTTVEAIREVARLVGMGRLAGQEFLLSPERPIVMGRASSCDVVLAEPVASREHTELVWTDGEWWIRDRNSSNGTYVNGQRIRERVLLNGDRIRIGSLDFRFLLGSGEDPDVLPTRALPPRPRRKESTLFTPINQILMATLLLMMICAGGIVSWQVMTVVGPKVTLKPAATPVDPRIAQAQAMMQAGDLAGASATIQAVLQQNPTSVEAQAVAAQIAAATPAPAPEPPKPATASTKPRTAASSTGAMTPAVTPPSDNGAVLSQLAAQAEAAVSSGDPASAVKILEKLVEMAPTSPQAASASVRIEQIKQSCARQGAGPWAASQKAIQQGDFVAARNQLKEAVKADPFNKDYRATLDGVQKKLLADAAATYKEARRQEDINETAVAAGLYRKVMTMVGDRSDDLYKRAEARLAGLHG